MQRTDRETIKEQITDRLGLLLEDPQILEHLLVDLDLVDVPDRVLAEEVERDLVRRRQRDVLEPERAAPDRVGLVLPLLVTGTEGEPIDQVDGRRALTRRHLFRLEVRRVIRTDSVDVSLFDIKVFTFGQPRRSWSDRALAVR